MRQLSAYQSAICKGGMLGDCFSVGKKLSADYLSGEGILCSVKDVFTIHANRVRLEDDDDLRNPLDRIISP